MMLRPSTALVKLSAAFPARENTISDASISSGLISQSYCAALSGVGSMSSISMRILISSEVFSGLLFFFELFFLILIGLIILDSFLPDRPAATKNALHRIMQSIYVAALPAGYVSQRTWSGAHLQDRCSDPQAWFSIMETCDRYFFMMYPSGSWNSSGHTVCPFTSLVIMHPP